MLVVFNRKLRNLRLGDDHALFAAEGLVFGFDVAEGPGNAQSPGQHSVRPIEHLARLPRNLPILIRNRNCLVCLSLVHLAAVILNPIKLILLIGPVILG